MEINDYDLHLFAPFKQFYNLPLDTFWATKEVCGIICITSIGQYTLRGRERLSPNDGGLTALQEIQVAVEICFEDAFKKCVIPQLRVALRKEDYRVA